MTFPLTPPCPTRPADTEVAALAILNVCRSRLQPARNLTLQGAKPSGKIHPEGEPPQKGGQRAGTRLVPGGVLLRCILNHRP